MGGFNKVDGSFLIGYQALTIILLPIYVLFFEQSLAMWLVMLALVYACGIGITTLYHRCYAHRSCELHPVIQAPLLFFGTLSVQGSALQWSYDHRNHHEHVDTRKDPYSIKRGFWDAHFLWMLRNRKAAREEDIPDLANNPLVRFQHRHYGLLMALANAFVVVLFGALFGDFFGAFVLLFLTRLFIGHHTTWFINSLAHTLGDKPFSREHSAVDNWLVSLVTYGEGYHNFHHTFPGDYRNGIRWYHYDPGKTLLWTLEKLGLAKTRRVHKTMIKQKALKAELTHLLGRARSAGRKNLSSLEAEARKRMERLHERLTEWQRVSNEYYAAKKAGLEKKSIAKSLKRARRGFRDELRLWSEFYTKTLDKVSA